MAKIKPVQRLGWFSTGRDKAARDLLTVAQRSIALGEIQAEIAFVFCNREPGESKQSDLFHRLVKSYGLPLVSFSSHNFKAERGEEWRLDYDREVMKRLKEFDADLDVLAGYMLIVGEEMCRKYDMINLHPAVQGGPKGSWQEVIWQLIESQAKKTGVMMHLVTPELDEGPPVAYCTFSIRGEPFDKYWREIEGKSSQEIKQGQGESNRLFKLIRKQGLAREFPLIISTLKAFSRGKVRIRKGKVIGADSRAIKGYNLTCELDKLFKKG
ncbi:MAG: phosphoglycerate transporter [Deltaproteobacteria bacterium]|nr:phosphoglycerate transporter [Deltaproteobacteria bacterium]